MRHVPIANPQALALVAACIPFFSMLFGQLLGPFASAFLLGAVLAGYLSFAHDVRSTGRLLSLAFTSGLIFFVVAFVILNGGGNDVQPVPGSGPAAMPLMLAGSVGAALLSTAFLLVVPSDGRLARVLAEIVVCTVAGGVLAAAGSILQDAGIYASSQPVLTILVVWQSGMAFALSFAAELRAAAARRAPSSARVSGRSAEWALAIIVFALTGVYGIGWLAGRRSLNNYEAAVASMVAEAPARENVPPPAERRLEDVFILRTIGRYTLQGKGGVRHQPGKDHYPGSHEPASPDRLVYDISYGDDARTTDTYDAVSVVIWQYPTREWARYDARRRAGTQRAIEEHQILSDMGEDYWYSDNYVLYVTGPRDSEQQVLRAYLAKYPSSIEPSFPRFFHVAAR